MTEVPQQTQTPAQQLGLVDGQFIVKRSDGEMQSGWEVMAVREVPVKGNHAQIETRVDIILPGPTDETTLIKSNIPLDKLRSWQPAPEEASGQEDTIPSERLREIGASPVEQMVSTTRVTAEATVPQDNPSDMNEQPQEVTSAATVESGASEPVQESDGKTTEHNDDTAVGSEKPVDEFIADPVAVAEIAKRLGLPREAAAHEVEIKLREQLAELDQVARSLAEFTPHSRRAVSEILATLGEGRNHLSGGSRREIQNFLENGYSILRTLAIDDKKLSSMPASIRNAVRELQPQIAHFGEQASVMMGRDMPRNLTGAFDTGPAQPVANTLRRIESLATSAAQSRSEVEEELAQVIGYRRVDEEHSTNSAEDRSAPDVFDVLASAEKTPSKAVRVKDGLREKFTKSLGDMVVDKPGDDAVKTRIEIAKTLVDSGEAEAILSAIPFMAEPQLSPELITKKYPAVWLDEPIYVDPVKIDGAGGFDSWLGRGYQGSGSVARREAPGGTRKSIDQIKDYATRDTTIPELSADGGLRVIVAKNGTFVFSENAHRAAAGKLRGEPLPVTAFEVIKYDGEL